ncbi:MAG TPA: glycosyltransferase, partial [Homoserinimonas sp.]|nr:glycosyltransferase [Homoserinimonas sp.]
MSHPVHHVLLTRFNLPSAGVERSIREHEGWLANRIELFDRYCVPSVRAQSNRNFSWIIYFDPHSPDWLTRRVRDYAESGLFTPLYRAAVSREDLLSDIRGTVAPGGGRLVTTNLDNDDALATDFVDRIQSLCDQERRTAIFLVTGLIKSGTGVYLRVDRDNAFCTVAEPWDAPVTCWADWHVLLRRSMPVVERQGQPAWLQVVHGENVSNRVRGRLADPRPWRPLFPGALDDVPAPRAVDLLGDRLVAAPARATREIARGGAKRLVLAVLGKDGLD